jgi:hypothetical protein
MVFDSLATKLIAEGNTAGQVFARDTCGGANGRWRLAAAGAI